MSAGPAGVPEGQRGARGSRARSRELGYSDAMREMRIILNGMGRQFLAAAAAAPSPEAGLALLEGAAALERAASYALDACMIYADERSCTIGRWMSLEWDVHHPAPKELDGGDR